ncbi:MAG: lytic transglycosylase domain-containing protein [Ferruginibacter sp.]|nr:lytic transglycosylase domain-containing protein [Cytophagales bacterium]
MGFSSLYFPFLFALAGFAFSQSAPVPVGPTLSKVVPLPASLTFAGEAVPLQDQEIRERLEKELLQVSYQHSATLLTLKRASRWQSQVQSALKERGVPGDFFYLAAIESGFDPYANSGKAEGFWQFRPLTAVQEGLEVDTMQDTRLRQVDQRRDVRRSTVAFCQLIRKNRDRLGNWTTAAAAYNAGLSATREVVNGQQTGSYYDLYLSPEPYRYVFRLLAMKLVMENPRQYGFELTEADRYQPLKSKSVEVRSTIENLVEFAREHGISYRTLKYYNPWIVYRPNNYRFEVKPGRVYRIEVPAD